LGDSSLFQFDAVTDYRSPSHALFNLKCLGRSDQFKLAAYFFSKSDNLEDGEVGVTPGNSRFLINNDAVRSKLIRWPILPSRGYQFRTESFEVQILEKAWYLYPQFIFMPMESQLHRTSTTKNEPAAQISCEK